MIENDVREHLHDRIAPGLQSLQPPADLLLALRRRQTRRSSGVVGALAVATASSALAAPFLVRELGNEDIIASTPATSTRTTNTPATGGSPQTSRAVTVGGILFELPSDLQVAHGPTTFETKSDTNSHEATAGGTTHYVVAHDGEVVSARAPAAEQPRSCIDEDVRPPGTRIADVDAVLMSCGETIFVKVFEGDLARPENVEARSLVHDGGDLEGEPGAVQPEPRSVDVGRGTATVRTFGDGNMIQLLVQLSEEKALDVMAQYLTEDEVLGIVRDALAAAPN